MGHGRGWEQGEGERKGKEGRGVGNRGCDGRGRRGRMAKVEVRGTREGGVGGMD